MIGPPDNPPAPPPGVLAAWLGQSRDLLALTDAAGRVAWANPGFERVLGLASGAMLPAPLIDAGARGACVDARVQLAHADGRTLTLLVSAAPLADQRLWTLRDVSAETELAARAQRLSELLTLAQEFGRLGIWERDIVTGKGRWDPQLFRFLGIDPSPDGAPPERGEGLRHTHPDDAVVATFERSTLAAGRYAQRYRVVHPDGSVRRLHAQWEVKNSPAGKPDRAIGILMDDTEAYELARVLGSSAAHLELAVDLADLIVWRHELKTDRVHYTERGYGLFGIPYARDGLPAREVQKLMHPDDEPVTAAAVREALKSTLPIDVETRYRRADGSWRYLLTRRIAERDASGRVVSFVGVSLDVTERHHANAALNTANERAALIARHAGIGTWESNADSENARWDEQMFLLRGLEPRATALSRVERLALVHPDDLPLVLDTHPDQGSLEAPTAYEFRVRWPDGNYRWLASRSAALFDAQGRVARRVGVNWDITEHKNAELARQQALLAERESRAKTQFLSRMSHELRTPLNAVLGFTQLLQLDARARADGAEQLAKLTHIRSAGEHLLALINDALDLSNLEAGTLKLDLQPVQIAGAVERALPLVAEAAAARRITIRTGPLDGTVKADPTRLHQVLLNVLNNAVKYNREGGSIAIDSMLAGPQAQISVRDTGRGMKPEQLAHLFEPFNRLGIETEAIEGSGIGLTIARALVEGMGGRIVATSEYGSGTVFDVRLPKAPADAADSAWLSDFRERTTISDGASLPGRHAGQLLYIEDNPVNVLLVEELVTHLPGLLIASENTGAAGVERARRLAPDLILVDMQLPDFDGFEVLRRLRSHPETARIPCIAVSANALPGDIESGLAGGFDDYWTKPIRFREFIKALERRFPPRPATCPS